MSILKVLLLSGMMFSGNSNIFKIVGMENEYYFPTSILLNLIYLSIMKVNMEFLKLALMLVFLSYFLLINLVNLQSFDVAYLIWPLNTLFLALFFQELLQKVSLQPSKIIYFAVLPLILFIGSVISGSERSFFIFGPNVLYRIFIIFGALIFFYSDKPHTKILGIIIAFLGASTGSRGFTISIAIFMLFAFLDTFANFKKRRTNVIIFIFAFIFINFFLPSIINERIFFFDPSSFSTESRLTFLYEIYVNFGYYFSPFGLDAQQLSFIFGFGDRLTYPHNYLVESFLYYGFFGFILTSLLTILALFSAKDVKSLCILLLLIVFCFVSGDFGDNYIVLAFSFALILSRNVSVQRNEVGVN